MISELREQERCETQNRLSSRVRGLQKYLMQTGLALGQSNFLVEDSLRDDSAGPVLSRAEILSEPYVPKDGSPCCIELVL